MRTNIDIDDSVLEAAMRSGLFKTKKDAVEAGLKLLARQAAYREVLRWEGKLHWDGDDLSSSAVVTGGAPTSRAVLAQEPRPKLAGKATARAAAKSGAKVQRARR